MPSSSSRRRCPLPGVAEGSRDIPHAMWGDPRRAARAGSSPGTPRGAPVPTGPLVSPGAAPALLEQRLPEERRFLESKGLRTGAACEPCREAEITCWETLCVLPEPPFFQCPAQHPVSSWTNSSVGQAELASTKQASRGLLGAGRHDTASVLGASRQQCKGDMSPVPPAGDWTLSHLSRGGGWRTGDCG